MTAAHDESRKPKAVYTDIEGLDIAPGIEMLRAAGYRVEHLPTRDPERIIRQVSDAEVLLIDFAELRAETLERLPALRLICVGAMGVSCVDVERATDLGITVTHLPPLSTDEVAGHALALALHLLRQLQSYAGPVSPDRWAAQPPLTPVRTTELTLGVLGLGNIGRRFAEFASPVFGGNVLGHDPFVTTSSSPLIRLASMQEVITRSDVISLHMPLTDDTRNLVDAAFLAAMKPAGYLINVSRGGLVDPRALRDALESGRLAGAALDVLDEEPPPADHPLSGAPRLTVTPHIGYQSRQTELEYVRVQAQEAVNFLLHGAPDHPVNAPAPAPHHLSRKARP